MRIHGSRRKPSAEAILRIASSSIGRLLRLLPPPVDRGRLRVFRHEYLRPQIQLRPSGPFEVGWPRMVAAPTSTIFSPLNHLKMTPDVIDHDPRSSIRAHV